MVTTCGASGVWFGTTVTRAGGSGCLRGGRRCHFSGDVDCAAGAVGATVVGAAVCAAIVNAPIPTKSVAAMTRIEKLLLTIENYQSLLFVILTCVRLSVNRCEP